MCGTYTKTIFLTDGNIKCIDQKPLEYITILISLGEECAVTKRPGKDPFVPYQFSICFLT